MEFTKTFILHILYWFQLKIVWRYKRFQTTKICELTNLCVDLSKLYESQVHSGEDYVLIFLDYGYITLLSYVSVYMLSLPHFCICFSIIVFISVFASAHSVTHYIT
jgi:hypothetical protein